MARQQVPLPRRTRALLAFVCVVVLVDTMFFTALTPLLPHYVHEAGPVQGGRRASWSPRTRWAP